MSNYMLKPEFAMLVSFKVPSGTKKKKRRARGRHLPFLPCPFPSVQSCAPLVLVGPAPSPPPMDAFWSVGFCAIVAVGTLGNASVLWIVLGE